MPKLHLLLLAATLTGSAQAQQCHVESAQLSPYIDGLTHPFFQIKSPAAAKAKSAHKCYAACCSLSSCQGWQTDSVNGCRLYTEGLGEISLVPQVEPYDPAAAAGFRSGCCKAYTCGHGGHCHHMNIKKCGHGGDCDNEEVPTCGHGGPCQTAADGDVDPKLCGHGGVCHDVLPKRCGHGGVCHDKEGAEAAQ